MSEKIISNIFKHIAELVTNNSLGNKKFRNNDISKLKSWIKKAFAETTYNIDQQKFKQNLELYQVILEKELGNDIYKENSKPRKLVRSLSTSICMLSIIILPIMSVLIFFGLAIAYKQKNKELPRWAEYFAWAGIGYLIMSRIHVFCSNTGLYNNIHNVIRRKWPSMNFDFVKLNVTEKELYNVFRDSQIFRIIKYKTIIEKDLGSLNLEELAYIVEIGKDLKNLSLKELAYIAEFPEFIGNNSQEHKNILEDINTLNTWYDENKAEIQKSYDKKLNDETARGLYDVLNHEPNKENHSFISKFKRKFFDRTSRNEYLTRGYGAISLEEPKHLIPFEICHEIVSVGKFTKSDLGSLRLTCKSPWAKKIEQKEEVSEMSILII